jgi:formylglycine-generating enzyme required for sulfatase activity
VVQGGTFNRSNDASYPATISDFRLDTYEVTVGRFRRFVESYPGSMPATGAGKNPNNGADPGWGGTWNGLLPADQAALRSALKCNAVYQTWTDTAGGNENRPVNCVSWHEAFAFCIWDGGRLPTEAEWNFAAAGGAEQREYPWSNPPSSTTIDCSYASHHDGTDCCGDGQAGCALTDVVLVGAKSPKGDGRWGHSDLAGNVNEWVLDWYHPAYPTPCTDCADLTTTTNRVVRGGSYYLPASAQLTSARRQNLPTDRFNTAGIRCARSAQ